MMNLLLDHGLGNTLAGFLVLEHDLLRLIVGLVHDAIDLRIQGDELSHHVAVHLVLHLPDDLFIRVVLHLRANRFGKIEVRPILVHPLIDVITADGINKRIGVGVNQIVATREALFHHVVVVVHHADLA